MGGAEDHREERSGVEWVGSLDFQVGWKERMPPRAPSPRGLLEKLPPTNFLKAVQDDFHSFFFLRKCGLFFFSFSSLFLPFEEAQEQGSDFCVYDPISYFIFLLRLRRGLIHSSSIAGRYWTGLVVKQTPRPIEFSSQHLPQRKIS